MHLIRRFFSNDASLAEDIQQSEIYLRQQLKGLFTWAAEEENAYRMLKNGAPYADLKDLFEKSVAHELKIIEGSEKTEHDIAQELDALLHHRHRRKLDIIIKALSDTEAQERLAYHLMDNLLSAVEDKAHTINALRASPNSERLRQALLHQLEFQAAIIAKMKQMKDLHTLLRNLMLGARREHELDEEEDRVARELEDYMFAIERTGERRWDATYDHHISQLTASLFTRIHETLNQHMVDEHIEMDPDEDEILVQSPRFEQFVREETSRLGVALSDIEFKAYVKAFRVNFSQR